MSALATAIVSMLSALLPLIGGASTGSIDTIINVLVQLIPEVVSEVEQVGPIIANTIAALRSNSAVTVAQLSALATVETQYDAAFEAAATAAGSPAPSA